MLRKQETRSFGEYDHLCVCSNCKVLSPSGANSVSWLPYHQQRLDPLQAEGVDHEPACAVALKPRYVHSRTHLSSQRREKHIKIESLDRMLSWDVPGKKLQEEEKAH